MMYYPLFIDFTDMAVLIVGGGEIAYRKGKELKKAGAKITLLTPSRIEAWETLDVTWKESSYVNQDLTPFSLVIAATDNDAVNADIIKVCKEKKIFCNSASKGNSGNAIFPGVVEKGGFTVAVTSQGKTPFLTKKVKEDIKATLEEYHEELIALLTETRSYIIKTYPQEKEVLLRKLAKAPMQTIEEKGNKHDITDWLQRK